MGYHFVSHLVALVAVSMKTRSKREQVAQEAGVSFALVLLLAVSSGQRCHQALRSFWKKQGNKNLHVYMDWSSEV